MKKIQTASEVQRRKKRNGAIAGIVMLAIMVLGVAGYAFAYALGANTQSSVVDKGSSVSIGGVAVNLINSRQEVQNVSINSYATLATYANKPLYIVASDTGIASEIASTIGRYAMRVQEACYGNCTKNLPEKDCTHGDNVIVWQDSQINEVYQNNSCVFIKGDMRAVDAFIYHTIPS